MSDQAIVHTKMAASVPNQIDPRRRSSARSDVVHAIAAPIITSTTPGPIHQTGALMTWARSEEPIVAADRVTRSASVVESGFQADRHRFMLKRGA